MLEIRYSESRNREALQKKTFTPCGRYTSCKAVDTSLPELANDEEQMFGYDKIKTEFLSVGEKEPGEIVDHLKKSASQWANGKEPDDDITFVVIKAM